MKLLKIKCIPAELLSTFRRNIHVLDNPENSKSYFEKLKNREFKNPVVVGFNINSNDDVRFVNQYASGAIVGSAFIKIIEHRIDKHEISAFIKNLKK